MKGFCQWLDNKMQHEELGIVCDFVANLNLILHLINLNCCSIRQSIGLTGKYLFVKKTIDWYD